MDIVHPPKVFPLNDSESIKLSQKLKLDIYYTGHMRFVHGIGANVEVLKINLAL